MLLSVDRSIRWRGPFLAEMEVLRRAIAWFGAGFLPPDTVVSSQVRSECCIELSFVYISATKPRVAP